MSDIQRITVRNATTELQIADNQTTGNIDIGAAQTTGNIYVGNSSARTTGAVQLGTLSGSGQTIIRGNTINANSNSSTTIQGASMNLITTSGTANLQANGSANVTSITSTANVTGATGSTIKATTGPMTVEATAGALDVTSSGAVTITSSGAASDITVQAGKDTRVQAAGDVIVETIDAAKTTFLGATNVNATTRLANGASSAGLVVASGQTSGSVTIGGNASRTGAIAFGSGSSNYLFNARAGSMNLQSTNAGGYINMTSVADITINSTAGTTSIQGADMSAFNGSFTPTIEDALGNPYGGVTSSGGYTKWGRQVEINGLIQWTSQGTASGTEYVQISGLPFNRFDSGGLVLGDFNNHLWYTGTGSSKITLRMASSNTITFYKGVDLLLVSDTTNSGSIVFAIKYLSA